MEWTTNKPTQAGIYKARCMESDGEEYECLIKEDQRAGLAIYDEQIGDYSLDHYHNGLTDLEWLGPLPK